MSLTIARVTASIGAVIDDLLTPAAVAEHADEIAQLVATHGVVFLRGDGTVDPLRHLAIADALGTIRQPPPYLPNLADAGYPQIGVLSTANGYGTKADRWHADVTWADAPPRYSILEMQELPPFGGDTTWLSACAAYDALSSRMQQFLLGLTAFHGIDATANGNRFVQGNDHPVVIVHPVTGRRALFVNPTFTRHINELSELESARLLSLLFEHTMRPEFACRHSWRVGEIGIWDNHFVQHYAVHDYGDHPRCIHRLEIEGTTPVAA